MPELSDLPVEILRMIAERCEFLPRFNLRSTSKSMKEVVDQSKLVLRKVYLGIRDHRSLQMSHWRSRNGNNTHQTIQMEIGNADSLEKTAEWMATILENAENASIYYFRIWLYGSEDRILMKDFLQKMKDNSKSLLKARQIVFHSKIDPFWICDESYCQRLTCYLYDDPNFFHEHSDTLMHLDEVRMWETMNITDEEVLSMKATDITLNSENFSAEMVNQMVDKFIVKGLIDSRFEIENPKGNFISDIKIPDGFIASTELEGWHEKIDGDKRMILWVLNDSVSLEIDPRSK